jgi:hypothetical protein
VTVSDAGGSVTSTPASLTVTARAPDPHDLRFQLVDAPGTVNGYGTIAGLFTDLPGRAASYYSPAIGTPLWLGSDVCAPSPPAPAGDSCSWFNAEMPTAAQSLIIAYGADFYSDLTADLQAGSSPPGGIGFPNGITPLSGGAVVSSLDIEPANSMFAVAWIQDPQQTGFEQNLSTVDLAGLPAAVAQQGAAGRVVTAISSNDGQITFFSYGWESDTTTVYETQVVTASTADAPTAAADLAQQGYIITAFGLADTSGDFVLVGTRVAGDTMARPFLTAQTSAAVQTIQQQGYAVVAVITQLSQEYTYLAER